MVFKTLHLLLNSVLKYAIRELQDNQDDVNLFGENINDA
jgi:hypothetical protein